MFLKSVANLFMACYWLSLIMKGFLGPEFSIICNNSLTALVSCSVVDNPGMMRCCGNIFTRSQFLSPLVLVYSRYSTDSAPFPVHCTILVLHVFPKFYAVLVFRVLKLLYLVVQGVFLKSQVAP